MLSELQLRSIAESVDVGISIISMPDVSEPETWIISFNNDAAAQASQAPIRHLIGKRFLEAFPEVRNTPFIDWYQQVARSGEPMELPEITYGDAVVPEAAFRVLLSPMPENAVLGQYVNVTLQRRAEGELKQLNEKLEQLVMERTAQLKMRRRSTREVSYAAAHELRTPLRRLLLSTSFSGEAEIDVEARNSLRQLDGQLDALLRYTAFDPEGHHETFRPKDVINDVLGVVASGLLEVEISTQIMDGEITANKTGFEVVCEQLLSNAVTYRREECASVAIEVAVEGADLVLFVSDNGLGIPRESLEDVFQAFRRLHPHEAYPGAGVGLTMCRDVVEAAGGRIWADSVLGEGTRFCAVFPGVATADET